LNEKQQANSKNLERGGGKAKKQKGKPLGETLQKDIKSHLDVL
jgi:hypothetical protein